MTKPLWSFALIARNESKTLPRLVASLKEFQDRGGEIVIVDTGSTDGTPDVARSLGCKVFEEGERFLTKLDGNLASAINDRFVIENEAPVVKGGDRLFDYSSARNYAASLTESDFVAMPDCDEVWTKLDIDVINSHIQVGVGRFEYNFVFSHDQFGREAVKFLHSKFYDRRKVRWTGIVHEVLVGDTRNQFLPENVMKLEHWQNPETNRSGYLPGLALDCFLHPDNDRNSHYFARELMWHGRPKSAIKEFERHIEMNRWPAERSQSMVYVGDCRAQLGQVDESLLWYCRAFLTEARREPLLRLAHHFWRQNDHKRAAAFANGTLVIPWDGFYSNNVSHYTHEPHEILYWALWYIGDREGSKQHWKKAFDYMPGYRKFQVDSQFYYPYPDNLIEGWMSVEELNWLHSTAKEMNSIVELGSWKGRSTHALCSGCSGSVTAVDHFGGSVGRPGFPLEPDHALALKNDSDAIFNAFKANTAQFKNLKVLRMSTQEASAQFADRSVDMVFVDAGHTYEDAVNDIRAWRKKARYMLCGHDYSDKWPEVMKAVKDEIGEVTVVDTIWYKDLRKSMVPSKKLSLRLMGVMVEEGIPFSFVKRGDGEQACMKGETGENCDKHPYTPELAQKLKDSFLFLESAAHVVDFHNQTDYNILLHRKDSDPADRKRFYETIRNSNRKKVFVGPRKLSKVCLMLKTEFVEVPEVNAFSAYEDVKKKILDKVEDGAIFLFSASLASKAWIADVIRHNSNVTCLDTGSAFDPIFLGETRTVQIPTEFLLELYKDWLVFPKVSVVIPSLGREEKLKRLLKLIDEHADYTNYEVIVKYDQWPPNNTGVPKLVKQATDECTGDFVMYLGNDCIPSPGFMRNAVVEMTVHFPELDGLIGLADGYWVAGEFAAHWMASKKLLPMLGGEFFHTGYIHCGCDNELTERCRMAGKYWWSREALVYHEHPIQNGFKETDEIYEWAYNLERQAHDKDLLTKRSQEFGFPPPKVYSWDDVKHIDRRLEKLKIKETIDRSV